MKAGQDGSLHSLHLFMAERQRPKAACIHCDLPQVQHVESKPSTGPEVSYRLLCVPASLMELPPRLVSGLTSTSSRSSAVDPSFGPADAHTSGLGQRLDGNSCQSEHSSCNTTMMRHRLDQDLHGGSARSSMKYRRGRLGPVGMRRR